MIMIYTVYLVLKSLENGIDQDIINRESKIYRDLASKLELHMYSIPSRRINSANRRNIRDSTRRYEYIRRAKRNLSRRKKSQI